MTVALPMAYWLVLCRRRTWIWEESVRKLGMLLSLLGGFLIGLGILALVYAPGQLMKTPLNVDSTTHLTGTAQLATAQGLQKFPVKATSITRADSNKSDGKVISFVNSSCLVRDEGTPPTCVSNSDPSNRLISASVDTFAADRKTGLAVNNPKYLPADATPHSGLLNKWPFQAAKKTYPYWDDLTSSSQDAKYVGTSKLDGLSVYEYAVTVTDAPIQIVQDVAGVYNDQKSVFIEPLTGAIINQVDHQTRVTTDGKPVLDLSLAFTPKQIAANVDDASANVTKLNLVRHVLPIVGLIGGVIALLVGLMLTRRGGNRSAASST